jgi:hypothetical protein
MSERIAQNTSELIKKANVGSMLNITEKGDTYTIGKIVGFKECLDWRYGWYYFFEIENGDEVFLAEQSVYDVKVGSDYPVFINICMDDNYEVVTDKKNYYDESDNTLYYHSSKIE